MIYIKTKKEIEIISAGGKILSDVMWELIKKVRIGISEIELDTLAQNLIIEKGGEPGFKKVPGYKNTICVSVNDVVVHGIPGEYKFKEEDVIGIDCGVIYKGFHTDMSETVKVHSHGFKTRNDGIDKFLETGRKALKEGISNAREGNRVGDISKAIQDIIEGSGYSVVRSLVGHGVGRDLHEEPEIPGFLTRKIERTPKLVEGMVIAVEVIYNMGGKNVVLADDGWTIRTEDKSLSGLFERTIAVTQDEPIILTK